MTCSTFAGSAGGLIRAEGGTGNSGQGGGGGGGRIAVDYAGLGAQHAVRFATSGGNGWYNSLLDSAWAYVAEGGTLWVPDTALLDSVLDGAQFSAVRLFAGTNAWAVDNLTVSNCSLAFADEGFRLTVTNDLRIDNGGSLGIGVPNGGTNGAVLTVGQDLVLTNGGHLYVYSGATNGTGPYYGARVGVTGALRVASSSWLCTFAHQANGAAPILQVGSLSIGAGGGINADGKGYDQDAGPGKGTPYVGGWGGGGGYGGRGGDGSQTVGGGTYGAIASPSLAGSGGGTYSAGAPGSRAGFGGGVVRIVAANGVTVDGTISADASDAWFASGAGSGGSVFIQSSTFGGNGGLIRAEGGDGSSSLGGGGGGGRIALAYSAISGTPTVRFSTAPGVGHPWGGTPGDRRTAWLGTLHFSDTNLLSSSPAGFGGYVAVPGFSSWAPANLTIGNGILGLPDGFPLSVGGDLLISGANAGLVMGTNSTLTCGGDLVVTNGGQLRVYAGPTNGLGVSYGALVDVTGEVRIGTSSWVYPHSYDLTNGAPLFRMGSLTVAGGGGFAADGAGYAHDKGPGTPGSPVSQYSGGGGHGGEGGAGLSYGGGATYGSSNAPVEAGSGGGSYQYWNPALRGGYGGGLVRLDVGGGVTLDGTIRSNGENGANASGAGSGGAIFVVCTSFEGGASGELQADGGTGGANGGGGGGGRIAVWYGVPEAKRAAILAGDLSGTVITSSYDKFEGTLDVNGGSGGHAAGSDGTAVFLSLPLSKGTLFLVR